MKPEKNREQDVIDDLFKKKCRVQILKGLFQKSKVLRNNHPLGVGIYLETGWEYHRNSQYALHRMLTIKL